MGENAYDGWCPVSDPLPSWLWEKLKAFLADEKTGVITFGVAQGRVKDYDFREYGKVQGEGALDKDKESCVK